METGQSESRAGGRRLRIFRLSVAAVLVAAFFVYPASAVASADRGSWNNWHVHDGTAVPYTDASGLTHRGAVFFPAIFTGGNVAAYVADPSLWAYCTDATDKALVGGDGGAKSAAGHCENVLNIIHLQGIATGEPAPAGWSVATTGGGFTVYYLLTPR
ncbi:MAG TPA: hypothetical protein VII27_03180 [Thermoplasmata archaeon]